ncbi:SpoIIE family protein phosphatase [Streptomyces sp. NPDC050315]|uniref:SpoIIE family protein phosphatase n=1 Tax=Streptomyces sp. NPDC050315 TaxID=3155039 RepID=UPI00342E52A6
MRHPLRAGPRSLLNPRSLAGQVFVLQVVIVVLLVAAAVSALALQATRDSTDAAEHRSRSVAETFAASAGAARAMDGPHPTADLQPRAEAVRKRADVDYIVVFGLDGIRVTHPDRKLIGKHVVGAFGPALEAARKGQPFTEIIPGGPLGDAVDTTAPITRADGSLVGMVSAGITLERAENTVERQMPVLLGAAALGLALAAGGTALVTRRLRRQTHGLGQAEMTRMYEHHDAVLHAVREGVVILGGDGRLLLVNDEARRLLELPDGRLDGRPVDELGLPDRLVELMRSGRSATDEVHHAANRLLAVNVRSTARAGGPRGSVTTLRDTTELAALTGRAEVAGERLKLLYESGVRIGTTLDVVRTAEELTEVAVPRFADIVTVDLLEAVTEGGEPAAHTDWRMRRLAAGGGHGDLPLYPVGDLVDFVPTTPQVASLESGRAMLQTDLLRDSAWANQDAVQKQRILDYGAHSLVTAPLRARGVVMGMANFWRLGDSPPFEEEDLSFAEEVTARAAVCIDNARRYAREHAMAVTLQRSLLPRGLPEQDALDVAWRYLPAQAGVGGDWFDVIPLPGARVALVVGDVVGHGLHAAATMGRLRTAVHNFSSLDLPVDELLGHLDELVTRIDSEEDSEGARGWEGVTGATCLYAIYDSVSGVCTVATAGHPGPALMGPDGTITYPEVAPSPPLGLGGHPFEPTELRLTEGSSLVLFTDGLVEDRGRDIDDGLNMLAGALERAAGRSPEEMCQAAVDAMVPERPSDDIALVVARTRLLAPTKVADWEVAPDPAEVGRLRAECGAQLAEWGLSDIVFSTELILSELITNAIRYGAPPVRLRLLRDRCLICEVADSSSTAPHLRRATSTDEGGRGLFLVAHLSQRWGTRYTPGGKVIWTEQQLSGASAAALETPADVLLDQFDDTGF